MNNKGFTLIELVAIVVVLAAIFLVSFPTLINTTRIDKEKEYDDLVENLCLAGKSYIYANINDYKELFTVNSTINITIEELIIYGNVDKNLVNPKTEKTIKEDSLIYTVLSDSSLDCEYNES